MTPVHNTLVGSQVSWVLDGRIDASAVSVEVHTFDLTEGVKIEAPRFDEDLVYGHHLVHVLSGAAKGHFIREEGMGQRQIDWGALAFIPAGLPIGFRTGHGWFRTCRCVFAPTEFESLAGRPTRWDPDRLESYVNINNLAIMSAMRRLWREALQPGFAHVHLADALATTIVIDLLRHFGGDAALDLTSKAKLAPWQLRRIEDCARNMGPGSPATVASFAQLCGISAAHLARCFKRTTGQTLHAYLEAVRIEEASKLLAEGKLSIREIAVANGFSAQSYFSMAFRRATGETPSQFRARIRGKPLHRPTRALAKA